MRKAGGMMGVAARLAPETLFLFVRDARAGARICYAKGWGLTQSDRLRNAMHRAAIEGYIYLVQRRAGDDGFHYLVERSSRPFGWPLKASA